ncbi:MAG: hypothetical protein B7Y15_07925, partial [Bacteroidetes bacterium 24-39-8]
MEILRKQIMVVAILMASMSSFAQNDAVIRKAYKDSYAQEYNKLYGEAIAILNKVKDDNSYEY